MHENTHGVERDSAEGEVLRPGTRALVQCEGFRCLAYLDEQGTWRENERDEPLPKILKIVEIVDF